MVFSVQILGRLRIFLAKHGLVALVLGTAALAGCGQKGPLFLPQPPKLAAPAIPAQPNSAAPAPLAPASATP
ncbi:lipoprotein [Polaromonas sp. OV174]|uniref:LPS translocon maturation chaperone LptM n=1 Tax=Polaromonas sp. OV174 TaxID=1855300 RepID=UPI000A8CDA9E